MPEEKPLHEIGVEELILVNGRFIFAGHELEDVDTDVIMRLMELAEEELEFRSTGIPKDTQIH